MNWIDINDGEKEINVNGDSKGIIEVLQNSKVEFFIRKKIGWRTSLIKRELINKGHLLTYKAEANRILSKNDSDKEGNNKKNPDDLEKIKQIQPGFKNTEWLYDLHWYTEQDINKEPYAPISLPLVMECEWGKIRGSDRVKKEFKNNKKKFLYGEVKFDFQKLVVANAALRLMIFRVNEKEDLCELNEYFEKVINGPNSYIHLADGAIFLFVAYHFSKKTFYYKEIINTK